MDKPIEHVTLVQIDLPRIGTAGGRGIGFGSRQCQEVVEVADREPETVRAAVIALAVKHGETASDLERLGHNSPNWNTSFKGMTFDVRNPDANTMYSNCYATCVLFDALKIDGRYFKLEELRLS